MPTALGTSFASDARVGGLLPTVLGYAEFRINGRALLSSSLRVGQMEIQ